MDPDEWNEQYLLSLVGQPESVRLEFKSGKALAKKADKDTFVLKQLSPAVSAFANSEGGIIVIGMDEDRSTKTRVASQLDGIAFGPGNAIESPEQFQQLLEGCISPPLPLLRSRRVGLSGHLQDRVAVVVHVPQGTTAYQAKDHIYYYRSEFAANPMDDYEVRLRMSRGKVARAAILMRLCGVDFGGERRDKMRAEHEPFMEASQDLLDALEKLPEQEQDEPTRRAIAMRHDPEQWLAHIDPKDFPDKISFDLVLRNDGELTIRDPAVVIDQIRSPQLFDGWTIHGGSLPARIEMRNEIIYPGDEREIVGSACQLQCQRKAALAEGDYVIGWKVFLDNSRPSADHIDLGTEIERARRDRTRG